MTDEQIKAGNEILNAFVYGSLHYAATCENVEFHNDWNRLHEAWEKMRPILTDKRRRNFYDCALSERRLAINIAKSNKKGVFNLLVNAIHEIEYKKHK